MQPPLPATNPRPTAPIRNGNGEAPVLPEDHKAVASVRELQAALAEPKLKTILLNHSLFDLKETADFIDGLPIGLIVTGGDLTIMPKEATRATIRLTGVPSRYSGGSLLSAIRLEAGALVLKRIRFELDAPRGCPPLTALAVQSGQLVLEDCEFVDTSMDKDPDAGTSVLKVVRHLLATRAPSITFRRCVFHGGRSVAILEEGSQVTLENCGLGVFHQPFVIRCQDRQPHRFKTQLLVDGAAWFAGVGPLIHLDSQQAFALSLNRSVLSQMQPSQGDSLLLLTRNPFSSCELRMSHNYLHHLGSLVVHVTDDGVQERVAGELNELRKLGQSFEDVASLAGAVNPWDDANPLQTLADGDPARAFRLKTSLPLVRATRDQILGPDRLLGRAGRGPRSPGGQGIHRRWPGDEAGNLQEPGQRLDRGRS
jgi:hypothetical protein